MRNIGVSLPQAANGRLVGVISEPPAPGLGRSEADFLLQTRHSAKQAREHRHPASDDPKRTVANGSYRAFEMPAQLPTMCVVLWPAGGPSVATKRTTLRSFNRMVPGIAERVAACKKPASPAAPDGVVAGPPAAIKPAGAAASCSSVTSSEIGRNGRKMSSADADARPQDNISAHVWRSPQSRYG
jgi:hypothetical protein